ncbi:MAG: CDP-diacylglycerol--serine O-phosphatidyltransferase [Alistipes sp.]|jgi:CDP-diacylglycerol--serine O-phosphatidyltransferase|nr:CDP-diacylglycerol--serine O-phosphatidyltransferase [Alistipes sp.]
MKSKLLTLPNVVTLANLACGCVALVFALRGSFVEVFALVAAAAVFDFADGAVARLTGRYSEIGRQLDSLADVVSFGVAPSAALFAAWERASGAVVPGAAGWAVFAVAMFSALRLARFNVDDTRHTEFTGLPTPAAGLAIVSLTAVWGAPPQWAVLAVAAAVSALLVCPLRMFSLKFSSFAWRENRLRYVLIAASAGLVLWLGTGGVATAVALYVVLNLARLAGPGGAGTAIVALALLLAAGQATAQTTTGRQNPAEAQRQQARQRPGQQQRPGQSGAAGEEEEDNTPFFGEGTEVDPASDTVKARRPRMPLESYHFSMEERQRRNMRWTIDPWANRIDIGHIDTLQNDFQNEYPFMKGSVGSANLGNLGAPAQWLNFFERETGRNHHFADPWGAYLRTIETMPFYNTKTPFSQLGYMWAGQKIHQEEDLIVIHAQNISPSTGVNLDYRSLGTKGIYQWQGTRNKTFSAGVNHTGKRWTLHAGYIHNRVYNQENGGMVDDEDVLLRLNEFEQPRTLPMSMSSPTNSVKSNTFFLQQTYGVPLIRITENDFTISDRPGFFVGHTFEYDRWARRYNDTYQGTVYTDPKPNGKPPQRYYDEWHFNGNASRDSLFEGRLTNRVFVQLQPWDRNGVIGTIDAGIGMDMLRYYGFDTGQYLTGVDATAVKETHTYVWGDANGRVGRYMDWQAWLRLHPFGKRRGDTDAGGNIATRLYIKERSLSVYGSIRFTTQEPSYWEQNYTSNHYMWRNSFAKENETRIEGSLAIPHVGFSATVSQSVLGNRIYYAQDSLPTQKVTIKPFQSSEVVGVTGVYLREDLPIRVGTDSRINLNHRVMLQWSSDQKVIPVPLASLYLSYNLEFNVVRDVLRLQIGVDGRYNTPYYAPGYNPGLGQFYNQRVKELGDYIWLDAYANAKWKRMRILIKMEHLSDDMFSRNSFSTLHYPVNRRVLKFGLSWNFYD